MIAFSPLKSGVPAEAVFEAPALSVSTDWFGATVTVPISWFLGLTNEAVYIGAAREEEPEILPRAAANTFFEGLWEADVAELFVASESGAYYLEFNLAPNAAWWVAAFDSYR